MRASSLTACSGMTSLIDPNGLSQSSGISECARRYGPAFARSVATAHTQFLACPDNTRYETPFGPVEFRIPAGPPWFARVYLPQELPPGH